MCPTPLFSNNSHRVPLRLKLPYEKLNAAEIVLVAMVVINYNTGCGSTGLAKRGFWVSIENARITFASADAMNRDRGLFITDIIGESAVQ